MILSQRLVCVFGLEESDVSWCCVLVCYDVDDGDGGDDDCEDDDDVLPVSDNIQIS